MVRLLGGSGTPILYSSVLVFGCLDCGICSDGVVGSMEPSFAFVSATCC
jgi:hypothetical protein